MQKFDIQSAKFMGILIGICLIFMIVVWHAFSYLPEETKTNKIQNEVVVPDDEEDKQTDNEAEREENKIEESDNMQANVAEDEYKEPDYKSIKYNSKREEYTPEKSNDKNPPELEPLDDRNLKETELNRNEEVVSHPETLEDTLSKAQEFRQGHKPISAIAEYQKAIKLTDNSSIKAQCYENIAIIYASAKRYGSALAYAQKAYNTMPTVSREILLARLYYKTGNTDKAESRVNSILRKDFTLE